VLLSFFTVDFFEAEEAPGDIESDLFLYVTNPHGCLIRVGAHDVEEELDGCWLVGAAHK